MATKKPSRSARVLLTTLYTGQSAPLAFGANNHQAENNADNVHLLHLLYQSGLNVFVSLHKYHIL